MPPCRFLTATAHRFDDDCAPVQLLQAVSSQTPTHYRDAVLRKYRAGDAPRLLRNMLMNALTDS